MNNCCNQTLADVLKIIDNFMKISREKTYYGTEEQIWINGTSVMKEIKNLKVKHE